MCGKIGSACSDWLFDTDILNVEQGAIVKLEADIVEEAPDGQKRVVRRAGEAVTVADANRYQVGELTLAERLGTEHAGYVEGTDVRKDLENKSAEPNAENKYAKVLGVELTPEVLEHLADEVKADEQFDADTAAVDPELPRRFGPDGGISFADPGFGEDMPRDAWDSEQR